MHSERKDYPLPLSRTVGGPLRSGTCKFAERKEDRFPVVLTLSEVNEKFKVTKNPNRFTEREKLEEGENDPALRRLLEDLSWCKFAFIKGDWATAFQIITKLKASLTSFRSLPPLFEETPNRVRELKVARDIYEQAVRMTPYSTDQDAFNMEFLQLKPFYADPCVSLLPPSAVKNIHFGYYLVELLEQNRIADFHTELRSLSATDLADSAIRRAVMMEKLVREDPNLDGQMPKKTTSNEISGCSSLSSNGTKEVLLKWKIIDQRAIVVDRIVQPVQEKSCPL